MSTKIRDIERIGVHECACVLERIGFVFREQSIEDYGIDAIIETQNDDYLLGKMVAIQIKSGESYFKEIKNNKVVYRFDQKHYDYWINHSLPVIIVLYSPERNECVWEEIEECKLEHCISKWKIEIPLDKKLVNGKEEIEAIANRSNEFEHRWNSLIVSKKMIVETLKNGESILEVQEWVNKSSGRGHFKLITNNGKKSKVLLDRELLGFGVRSYDKVIRWLFPWAELSIDEEFYNANIDDYYKNKLINKKGKSDNAQNDIFPYRNSIEEVDFYRLVVKVNEIGKSFLEMEKFLKEGKCYWLK